jgi:hypothetical protein
VVRIEDTDIWLLAKPFDRLGEGIAQLLFDVMEASAYWVWHVAPMVLAKAPSPPRNIVIYADIDDERVWQAGEVPDVEPSEYDILFGADRERAEGFVTLGTGLRSALHKADNRGERHRFRPSRDHYDDRPGWRFAGPQPRRRS